MLTHRGEWWREFRTYISVFNLHYEGVEAERAAVELHKEGHPPLRAIQIMQERGVITT